MLVSNNKPCGFTLIELVIGISLISVVLLIMTGALFPQAQRSTDPWFQVRSAELANSIMNEVLARKFDENSYVVGDLRCGENTGVSQAPACTPMAGFGPDNSNNTESNRADFDDVDDFHNLTLNPGVDIDSVYQGFSARISVVYVGANKLVTVTVDPPRGAEITYASLKANY